jgi:uncharacterized protein (TIGR04222 family)
MVYPVWRASGGGGLKTVRWTLALLVGAIALAIGGFLSSASAQFEERIREFDVTLTVSVDGDLEIREQITYDFGSTERHGILRDVPVRFYYDDTFDRVYHLEVLGVASDTAPDEYVREDAGGGYTRLRVGDADRTITGEHTYTIHYRLEGALNGFTDHDELYWNATGNEWGVPIDHATVTVNLPAAIQDALCFAGPTRSNAPCDSSEVRARSVIFLHSGLRPYEGVTIVASIPSGVVPTPEPILAERWSFTRAFALNRVTVGLTALLSLVVVGGIGRTFWLVGRDRRWAGSVVDARFGTPNGAAERVPLFEGSPFPVEYSPPGNLRPGLIGTLRDEVAHPLDVTATIIDLATRHYLRIEEVTTSGMLRNKTDWRLHRMDPQPREPLLAYERKLMDALFEDGESVDISALRQKFSSHLHGVQQSLYDEMVAQGWYRRSPRATRTQWLVVGLLALVLSVGLFVAAVAFTEWAIVPIPLMVGAVALIAGHNTTPARTAKGSAALRRVRGFERFISSAELYRAQFAEQSRTFYDYLPYAVVFGLTDEWAKAFEGLADLPQPDWYSGGTGYLAPLVLADNLTRFTQESAGAIAATPASSGSSGFGGGGFSGGGGGGGGGGSW